MPPLSSEAAIGFTLAVEYDEGPLQSFQDTYQDTSAMLEAGLEKMVEMANAVETAFTSVIEKVGELAENMMTLARASGGAATAGMEVTEAFEPAAGQMVTEDLSDAEVAAMQGISVEDLPVRTDPGAVPGGQDVAFEGLGEGIVDALIDRAPELAQEFAFAFGEMESRDAMAGFTDAPDLGLGGGGDSGGGTWAKIAEILTDLWDMIKPLAAIFALAALMGRVLEPFIVILNDFADAMIAPLQHFMIMVGREMAPLFEHISGMIYGMVSKLLPIAQAFIRDVLLPTVMEFFEALEPLGPVLMDMLQELLPVLMDLVKAMAPLFKVLGELTVMILQTLIPIFVYLVKDIAVPLLKIIVEGWAGLLETVTAVAKAISFELGELGISFEALGEWWDGIADGIADVVYELWANWDHWAGEIADSWIAAWDTIVNFWSETWQSLKDAVASGLEWIWNFVTTWLNPVVWIQAAYEWVVSVFDAMWSFIKEALGTIVSKTMEAAYAIPMAIVTGIGKGVSAVVEGVKSMWSAVADYLPFSDARLGPLSDLTDRGEAFAATLAKGINVGEDEVVKAVGDVTAQAEVVATQLPTAEIPTKMVLDEDGIPTIPGKAFPDPKKTAEPVVAAIHEMMTLMRQLSVRESESSRNEKLRSELSALGSFEV